MLTSFGYEYSVYICGFVNILWWGPPDAPKHWISTYFDIFSTQLHLFSTYFHLCSIIRSPRAGNRPEHKHFKGILQHIFRGISQYFSMFHKISLNFTKMIGFSYVPISVDLIWLSISCIDI